MKRKPTITIYRDESGNYRWRLRAANGRIQSSGQGHGSRRDALRAAMSMMRAVMAGPIIRVAP